MKRSDKRHRTVFSVYKVDEGGLGQRASLAILREAGIACEPAYSPYVGQIGVAVFGGARIVRRAERLLFGS
jgi:hypothetical protein